MSLIKKKMKTPTADQAKQKTNNLGEFASSLLWAGLLAIAIRSFMFEPFNIPSGSMIPTNLVGDFLFVSKFSYGYSHYSLPFSPPLFEGRIIGRRPERGDVAVFRVPYDTSVDFIKRVIGLPGDRIQMKGGILHINGVPVKLERIEDYEVMEQGVVRKVPQYIETLPNGVKHRILKYMPFGMWHLDNTVEYHVPEGHYFMMGDNRDRSEDSRVQSSVGFIPEENFIGRAEILFFSFDKENTRWWEFWKWPIAIRYSRLGQLIR